MKAAFGPVGLTISVLIVLGVAISACTDEKTIFVERPFFDDPPPAAQGFLGYDEADKKLTVCGNCHIGQQTRWVHTDHASAWKTLTDSGHSQAFCENCHTVGPNGNPTDGDVGWQGSGDTRYHDVQCESCHGPGLAHVENPDFSQPHASITVGSDPAVGCAECHQGSHHPFVEDWERSEHATVNSFVRGRAISDPAHYEECLDCHSGQGALAAWGINVDYIEKDDPIDTHVGIVCAVCHDPHNDVNQGQLRFPIDIPSEEQNLCMKCHHKRAQPEQEAETLRGPHSPEGPLLLGDAGWWPPNFQPEVDRIVATHGTTGNPRLCASCHVASFDVTDTETGDFLVTATGHLFEAIPCLDATGAPDPDGNCDIAERTFEGCAVSGCHGTPASARSAYLTAKGRIEDLVIEIDNLLLQVPAGQLDRNDGVFTVADGAWFNARLGELPGTSTHNPFLSEQLLVASIAALENEYGLSASPWISMTRMFK